MRVTTARRSVLASIIVFLLSVRGVPASAISCGDTIGPSESVVVLLEDVTGPCTDPSKPVLSVVGPVKVNLKGHTISCQDGSGLGIRITGANAVVKNGVVRGCDTGVVVGSMHRVVRLTVRDNRRFGIIASDHNTFIGNVVSGHDDYGFWVSGIGNSVGNSLVNNTVSRNGRGFFIDSLADSVLIGNTAAENRDDGFSFFEGENNTLIGNIATKNGGDGFYIDAGFSYTLRDNLAKRNGGSGVVIDAGGFYDIANNTAKRNGGAGLRVTALGGPVGYTSVTGNRSVYNGEHGIELSCQVSCSRIHFVSNSAHGNIGLAGLPAFDLSGTCLADPWDPEDTWHDNDFDTRSDACIH